MRDVRLSDVGSALGELAMGQYQTFIVRLWTDGANGVVRGHIQHIASRRGVYFRDSDRMLQFIQEHLGPAPLPLAATEGFEQLPIDERSDPSEGTAER